MTQNDMDIIREAIKQYQEEVKEEILWAVQSAKSGEWGEVWEVTKANKGIILGVAVPTALLLRYGAQV